MQYDTGAQEEATCWQETKNTRCIECGLPYGADGFDLHYGLIENGPAYWCDRGLLCSPQCSLEHHRKRAAEGTLPTEPAANPFE